MNEADLAVQLRTGAAALGLALSEAQAATFLRYLELLRRWKRRARLTALTAGDAVVHLHFLDSLTVLRADLAEGAGVIDVGSGAGFPGIPLAIARPDLHVALLEPSARRAAFLELVAAELGIPLNVRQDRAEVAGHDQQWRACFDVAVARAVAKSVVLLEMLLPFVKIGGKAVLLKGPSAEPDVAEVRQSASILGGELAEVIRVTLPRGERRVLMIIAKVAFTPERFPRVTVLRSRRTPAPEETSP